MRRTRGRRAATGASAPVGVGLALGALVLVGGCTAASSPPSGPVQATAQRDGLVVHVSARTSSPARTVQVVVRAEADHAPGALTYAVRYGDGAVAHNRVPQYCVAPPGPRRQATWHLTHRYAKTGTYHLSVRVGVNCAAGATVTTGLRLEVG